MLHPKTGSMERRCSGCSVRVKAEKETVAKITKLKAEAVEEAEKEKGLKAQVGRITDAEAEALLRELRATQARLEAQEVAFAKAEEEAQAERGLKAQVGRITDAEAEALLREMRATQARLETELEAQEAASAKAKEEARIFHIQFMCR